MLRKSSRRLLTRLSSNNYQTLNWIELDQSRILHNFNFFKERSRLQIIPVLKANAYGHGLSEIAQILNQADCLFLAVDGYFEAAKIRDITKHRILVMGYINPENVRLLDTRRCSFVLQDRESIRTFGKLRKPVRVHMEINTGMNRLGLKPEEINHYLNELRKFPKLELEGIMTHLADADNEVDESFTNQQVELFDQSVGQILEKGLNPKFIHIAQTAGSTKVDSKYANAMRLGIGLYGINPLGKKDKHYSDLANLKPALRLKSTIIKISELDKGDKVSYNGIFTAPAKMRIAILPLGYYECIPRVLSNKGIVTYQGNRLPIVGRVCMNHTTIDLKDLDVKVGDEVMVIDNDDSKPNSVTNISTTYKLFDYELLTSLSSSIRRKII